MHHVIVHPSAVLIVQPLGVHKLLQCNLRDTIDAGDKPLSLVIGFCIPAAVRNDTAQTGYALGAWTVDDLHNRRYDHRLRFRIPESKELTCP